MSKKTAIKVQVSPNNPSISDQLSSKVLPSDPINHPAHYASGKIEVIEAIEDWQLGFHLGNAVKYVARAGKKDPAKTVEDLEKSIWYIRRKIALLKGNAPRPNDMDKVPGLPFTAEQLQRIKTPGVK